MWCGSGLLPDPGRKGKPIEISIGVYVLDIARIHDTLQDFSDDMAVHWQDNCHRRGLAGPRREAADPAWHAASSIS